MSQKLNILLALNAYADTNPTNTPTKSFVKWSNDLRGIEIDEPKAFSKELAPGESVTLFSGEVTISDDGTTTYDLSLKAGTTNTYALEHNSGTAPAFRTARTSGADATTHVTVTANGPLLIFTSTGGTALSLIAGGVIVGDKVRIGSLFNSLNQGELTILARTTTSFTAENASGAAEGPITLGAGFANQISIYSAAGVQVGDKVKIDSGFSSVSFGTYEITAVLGASSIEFFSSQVLPEETNVGENLNIYNNSQSFLYVESSKTATLTINSSNSISINPILLGTALKNGMFMVNSEIYSAVITNTSTDTSTINAVSAE